MTKTTFHLSEDLLARLKTAAANHDTTVRELLVQGAQLALDKLEGVRDREALRQRAVIARRRLRGGLFGDTRYTAGDTDSLLYAAEPRAKYPGK